MTLKQWILHGWSSHRWAVVGWCALIGISGCGDGRPVRVPVAGQVLIDGHPLTHGYVRFAPANSRASTGQLDARGHFTLTCFEPGDGAVIGTHKVSVMAQEPIGQETIKWHARKNMPIRKPPSSRWKSQDRPIRSSSFLHGMANQGRSWNGNDEAIDGGLFRRRTRTTSIDTYVAALLHSNQLRIGIVAQVFAVTVGGDVVGRGGLDIVVVVRQLREEAVQRRAVGEVNSALPIGRTAVVMIQERGIRNGYRCLRAIAILL